MCIPLPVSLSDHLALYNIKAIRLVLNPHLASPTATTDFPFWEFLPQNERFAGWGRWWYANIISFLPSFSCSLSLTFHLCFERSEYLIILFWLLSRETLHFSWELVLLPLIHWSSQAYCCSYWRSLLKFLWVHGCHRWAEPIPSCCPLSLSIRLVFPPLKYYAFSVPFLCSLSTAQFLFSVLSSARPTHYFRSIRFRRCSSRISAPREFVETFLDCERFLDYFFWSCTSVVDSFLRQVGIFLDCGNRIADYRLCVPYFHMDCS